MRYLGIRSDKVEKGSKRTNQNVRKFASNRTWTSIRSTEQSTISNRHLSWASIRRCNETITGVFFAKFCIWMCFFLKLDKARLLKILKRLCHSQGTNFTSFDEYLSTSLYIREALLLSRQLKNESKVINKIAVYNQLLAISMTCITRRLVKWLYWKLYWITDTIWNNRIFYKPINVILYCYPVTLTSLWLLTT